VDERYSVERVGYAARLAMELGVDVVKTYYTGSPETFSRVVVIAAPALVVAAGNPHLESDADVLRMARGVVEAEAAGFTFGRNNWQSAAPRRLVRALKEVLHAECSVEDALRISAVDQTDRQAKASSEPSPRRSAHASSPAVMGR
jgi:DhnA family fructose-bisphosphate aldolase class Ia